MGRLEDSEDVCAHIDSNARKAAASVGVIRRTMGAAKVAPSYYKKLAKEKTNVYHLDAMPKPLKPPGRAA